MVTRVSKNKMGGSALGYRVPLLSNQLPASACEADALFTFKARLKTFLYDKSCSYYYGFLETSFGHAAMGLECWTDDMSSLCYCLYSLLSLRLCFILLPSPTLSFVFFSIETTT